LCARLSRTTTALPKPLSKRTFVDVTREQHALPSLHSARSPARLGVALRSTLSALPAAVLSVAVATASCTVETGGKDSFIRGEIDALDCWSGQFDLKPDYFAAVPFARDDSLQVRIQNGGDFVSFSDGVFILIEKLQEARKQLRESTTSPPSLTLSVSLPPEVTPPGVPVSATRSPSRVHMSLYLQRSCHVQNVALYAPDRVSLGANGECIGANAPVVDCSNSSATSATGTSNDAGTEDTRDATSHGSVNDASPGAPEADAAKLTVGESSITFYNLFSGDPDERSTDERFTKAKFTIYLADPRDICPGGLGPPPKCRGRLEGSFDFYFQRGRPAQPFP
jgi:hypothetical protein